MTLLSLRERVGATTLLEEVEYVELSDRPDFNDRFVDQLAFPTGGRGQRASRNQAALIACGAIAQPAARIVAEHGWPVDVHPLPPLLHNQPHLIAGEVERLAGELRCVVRLGGGGVRRLRHLRRPRRGLRAARAAAARGTALLRRVRRRQPDRGVLRRPARHLPAHRLPGEVLRPHRRDRARPGPLAGAARRVLPPLHPGRLARPGRDPRAARSRRGRRGPARPPADRRTHRQRRPRARPGRPGRADRFPRTPGETAGRGTLRPPAHSLPAPCRIRTTGAQPTSRAAPGATPRSRRSG